MYHIPHRKKTLQGTTVINVESTLTINQSKCTVYSVHTGLSNYLPLYILGLKM